MKPYVSLDLETTGLDPEVCQIIEIGAVLDLLDRPVEECPTFHRYVRHKLYVGEPYALALNSAILQKLADPTGSDFCCADDIPALLHGWLKSCGIDEPVTFAGKNYGSFDLQFLRRLSGFSTIPQNYRSLDVGSMYFSPHIHEHVPGMKECKQMARMPDGISHTALEDALDVCRLIRFQLCPCAT